MISKIVKNIFNKCINTGNNFYIYNFSYNLNKINQLEKITTNLTISQIKKTITLFKLCVRIGINMNFLLPECFAIVREASKRFLHMRHFDVQILGGIVLHYGGIAEMQTGEGKTIVTTLASCLNVLSYKNVNIITVNDYLAKRDYEWMKPLYDNLDISSGVLLSNSELKDRIKIYKCNIIYGANNEFGFDYLKDNMAYNHQNIMQKNFSFSILDEVDYVLIDEARTPMIISSPKKKCLSIYYNINKIVKSLIYEYEQKNHYYIVDFKLKHVFLTESGYVYLENIFKYSNLLNDCKSLYDYNYIKLVSYIYISLKAHIFYKNNDDYIVSNNDIVLVDEYTGRPMIGKRLGGGLHSAIEAKENLNIKNESLPLISITYQNYFQLYNKISGMTGTALTEENEFKDIYNLHVVSIKQNKLSLRDDYYDLVYLSKREKFVSIVNDIKYCIQLEQPVLVGTISIKDSEYISCLLKHKNIDHDILNAKFYKEESKIIGDAGYPGSITIATNIAGRGTDIVLGGALTNNNASDWLKKRNKVIEVGGLRVIGSERHNARRIDNQLRGRAGRQGDPGSTQFYLSLDDKLIKIFITNKYKSLLNNIKMSPGEIITHPWVNKMIQHAQNKIEIYNFETRKNLLSFDNVISEQRNIIFEQRKRIIQPEFVSIKLANTLIDSIVIIIKCFLFSKNRMHWNIVELETALNREYGLNINIIQWITNHNGLSAKSLNKIIITYFLTCYLNKKSYFGDNVFNFIKQNAFLKVIDAQWEEHLFNIEELGKGIHLRSYGQKNPIQEYKNDAYVIFVNTIENIRKEVISLVLKL